MGDSAVTMPGRDAIVSLREITSETVRTITSLNVAPEQSGFVATNADSIAEAYFERELAWFRAVYAGDVPVGFVMLEDDAAKQEYSLWRFMIDVRYQGHGYGRCAIDLVIAYVRTRPGAQALLTSCVPGEGSPCPFYERLGFRPTGEVDDGEIVMKLEL